MKYIWLAVIGLVACNGAKNSDENTTADSTAAENMNNSDMNDQWEPLFDGETTDGWHNYNSDSIGIAWKAENGVLYLDDSLKDGWQIQGGGDIVTDKPYENYELVIDWKISEGGNSGIVYHVQEGDYDYVWHTGPEYQLLDDARHDDGKILKHRTGDLYDLVQASDTVSNPVGDWNTTRIISDHGKIEHWLNDTKLLEVDMNSDHWKELVSQSKFKDMPDFGKFTQGHIALQDHGHQIWFRNIKIRLL